MYLLRKGAYREISHIILKHTQYATSWYQKYLHKRKGGEIMTATNMCSNFGGFRCSPPWLRRRFFINFMPEKLRSADAEEMGIDMHMVASLCRLGNNAISMSLVSNSFSCMDISPFGWLMWSWRYIFHSETMVTFSNSVPSNDLASKYLPNNPMRLWIELSAI